MIGWLDTVVQGVLLGRQTYANTIKYVKMAASSNFGNVFSVLVASVWLPFLPTIEARALPEKLKKLPADWIYASLSVRGPATQGHGMHGSAMFVVNPPWTLKAALEESLPWLTQVLALDEKAGWVVESSTAAAAKPRDD